MNTFCTKHTGICERCGGYVDASIPDQIGSERIKMGSKLNSTLPEGFMDLPPSTGQMNPEDVPF